MKISVIGAGSITFSLKLIQDLCLTKGLHDSQICLMDLDEERLQAICLLGSRYAKELGINLKFEKTLNRQDALKGADFVINTADPRSHDEIVKEKNVGRKHGIYRGYGSYPYPQLELQLEVARDMERLCPDAWLIQVGNPVLEGCTMLTRETNLKVVGICHGIFNYRHIAQVLELDLKRVYVEAPGLNHCIWLTRFEYDGKDAYPLLDEWIEKHSEEYWRTRKPDPWGFQMSRGAIHQYKLFGLMPTSDMPRGMGWWYHTDLKTKKYWFGPTGGVDARASWSVYLKGLNQQLEKIKNAVLDTGCQLTKIFPLAKSDEPIIPIIDALVNDHEFESQVNIPNKGILEGIPDDIAVEVPAILNKKGIHPRITRQLPKNIILQIIMLLAWKAECRIHAFLTGDSRILITLALQDEDAHQVASYQQAEELVQEILSLPFNKKVAERFGMNRST